MPRPTPSSALARLRVLDLSRVRAGPTCARIFADFGAVTNMHAVPNACAVADVNVFFDDRRWMNFRHIYRGDGLWSLI